MIAWKLFVSSLKQNIYFLPMKKKKVFVSMENCASLLNGRII